MTLTEFEKRHNKESALLREAKGLKEVLSKKFGLSFGDDALMISEDLREKLIPILDARIAEILEEVDYGKGDRKAPDQVSTSVGSTGRDQAVKGNLGIKNTPNQWSDAPRSFNGAESQEFAPAKTQRYRVDFLGIDQGQPFQQVEVVEAMSEGDVPDLLAQKYHNVTIRGITRA